MEVEAEETGGTRKTRRERFLTVAERRTREILHKIRLLGNCSNKSSYEYSEDEVARIFEAIERELHAARARFQGPKEIEFHLQPPTDEK